MACMRGVNASDLAIAQWATFDGLFGFPFGPTTDGDFLPYDPVQMFIDGNIKRTDVIVGSNKDEGRKKVVLDIE